MTILVRARTHAASVINAVLNQHRSLNGLLKKILANVAIHDRSLCKQLCYGVIRWQLTLQAIARQLLNTPIKKRNADISALLLCGLYQLRTLRIPDHAVINEIVDACKVLGKPWATKLINACLRHYQRDKQTVENPISLQESTRYAHPQWLIDKLKQDWPDNRQAILDANNQQPPMMLRINQNYNSPTAYLAQLQQANIDGKLLPQTPEGILLDPPCDALKLPGFTDGHVSVQDSAAQLFTNLLDIKPGQYILDACAALGGKTGHILESQPDNSVVAVDIDAERLQQVKQNITRLKLPATLIAADVCDVNCWWNGQKFDRILLDAPCSGTGVIRRHPDIKVLRRPEDIAALAKKQQMLLESLWPLLKTDGLLVYTTCSALKEENEIRMMNFLQRHANAQEQIISKQPASLVSIGYQRLPGDDILDGFYYACIRQR